MRGKFDLHLHTMASDGVLEPEEVVRRAAQAGLLCIAITDHDTDRGIERARQESRRLQGILPVIGGMELTAEFPGEMHILGYGMDFESPAWQSFSAEQRRRRAERNSQMLDRMEALGLDIAEEYRPWNVPGEYGRMHMALGLVQAGEAGNVQEAFERYLRMGAPAYMKRRKFTSAEIISAVKEAGGIAVLAHPGRMNAALAEIKKLVLELKEQGLGGVEAFYPSHEPEEAEYYRELAQSAGLVCTYGSDWHGLDKSGLAWGFDDFKIPDSTYAWLENLAKRAGGHP
jgi:3',5'-nucleoside bisphosphate phosphatase